MKFRLEIIPAIPVQVINKIADVLKANGYRVWGSAADDDKSACDIFFGTVTKDKEEGK